MNTSTPHCCNQESEWVENIPGKGYYFCKSCRNEVSLLADEEQPEYDPDEDDDPFNIHIMQAFSNYSSNYDNDDDFLDYLDAMSDPDTASD